MDSFRERLLLLMVCGGTIFGSGGALLSLDCNRNGIDDRLDISSGVSRDCNGNSIPDECDIAPGNFILVRIPPSFSTGEFIAAADFDGDGLQDLAQLRSYIDNARIFLNRGNLEFQEAASLSVPRLPWSLAAGDLDGDGLVDMATANLSTRDVSVFLNQGGGQLSFIRSHPVGIQPISVAAADLDGDGDLDLAVANSGPDTVTILLNDGSAAFPVSAEFPTNYGMQPYFVTPADLDRDGAMDLVVSPGRVFWNGGGGSFLEGPPIRGWAAAAADLDGDGLLDLATTDANAVSVMLAEGGRQFAEAMRYAADSTPGPIVSADLNGDGLPDLAVADRAAFVTRVFLGLGDGTLLPGIEFPWGRVRSMAAADLDGDGVPEIALPDGTILKPGIGAHDQDCNSNGVPDGCDLKAGTSKDCDENGIPDVCEIAADPSLDDDGDGILNACEPLQFAYGFNGYPSRITGRPGSVESFEVYATLTTRHNPSPDGAQGWVFCLYINENGAISSITLKGVVVSTIYDADLDEDPSTPPVHFDPYDQDLGAPEVFTKIAQKCTRSDNFEMKGACSAVVMRGQEKMVLQPVGTQRIAKLIVQAMVPEGPDCIPVTLNFGDNCRCGGSQPVRNVVIWQGSSQVPVEGSCTILVCPDRFRRGDANSDARVDISDVIRILMYLFLGGRAPTCYDAADTDDNGGVDITDAIVIIDDIFRPGTGIAEPGPFACGPDPTPDGLGCSSYPDCD